MAAYDLYGGDPVADLQFAPTGPAVNGQEPVYDLADEGGEADGLDDEDGLDEDGNFPHDDEEEDRTYIF